MTTATRAEQQHKAPPIEARCQTCGGWIATVPGGTTWAQARCGNRRCAKYGLAQRIIFRTK